MDEYELNRQVETCLAQSLAGANPYHHLADIVAAMKASPVWTDDEIVEMQSFIIEVQSRVNRALVERLESRGTT